MEGEGPPQAECRGGAGTPGGGAQLPEGPDEGGGSLAAVGAEEEGQSATLAKKGEIKLDCCFNFLNYIIFEASIVLKQVK